MNGWNNNSTAKLFKTSFRKILHVADVSVPVSANCIPQDNTVLLNTTLSDEFVKNEQEINSIQKEADVESKDFANIVFTDHLKQNTWCLNEYAENVITYISGYVAKTVFKKINCFFCKQLLISSEIQKEIDTCKLLQRKNRNGLCQASSDVIVICKK